mgnify:CR=1 FL=1
MISKKMCGIAVALFSTCILNSLFAEYSVSIEGNHLIRLPGSSRYREDNFERFPNNSIISVPDERNASSSYLLLNEHRIQLYPGCVCKISDATLIPLSGRFEFDSDATATTSVFIATDRCNASYSSGNFFIEATPDNGVFFALKDNGKIWIKDSYRQVFEMRSGQQIHIPLFGTSVLKNHMEGFWNREPSGFDNLGEAGQEGAYGIVSYNNPETMKNTEPEQTEESEEGNVLENAEEIAGQSNSEFSEQTEKPLEDIQQDIASDSETL